MGTGNDTGSLRIIRSATGKSVDKIAIPVRKSQVINALNRIHFQEGDVFVCLKHEKYHSYITIPARPFPCSGGEVKLAWLLPDKELPENLGRYRYKNFFYTDGLKKIRVEASLGSISEEGVELELADKSYEVSCRSFRRYKCLPVTTGITQSNLNLQGVLKDFSGAGFAVDVSGTDTEILQSLNSETPAYAMIRNDNEILFAEVCRIIRTSSDEPERVVVLSPLAKNIQRFRSKQSRSVREKLNPQPNIVFRHPFLEKTVSLKTLDISGSGLAVEEEPSNTLLMPGMIIPDMAISFSGNFKIGCKAQVLFTRFDQSREACKSGLAYLDMGVESQLQLSSILYQVKNESSYVGGEVDLDDLWDFFFETGFIYPAKYCSIEKQRDKFKELYSRLYNDAPDIARHIIYQDRGTIYGHVSMFRYYRQTWLMHHHAAVRSNKHKAGLVVMDHILQHINEVHNLRATAMKYIACYYRPNNRFADRSFGGASRSLDDPKKSSLDDFAYFQYCRGDEENTLPAGWELVESNREDFIILKSLYNEISGGLMLEGLDLTSEAPAGEAELNNIYRERGFVRSRKFYSLKTGEGHLGAMFVLNHSDTGLNMSSLTDCIQVIVVDPETIRSHHIHVVLDELSRRYDDAVSVLLFPRAYADSEKMQYKHIYVFGVLDLKYISQFLGFMENLTRSPLRLAK